MWVRWCRSSTEKPTKPAPSRFSRCPRTRRGTFRANAQHHLGSPPIITGRALGLSHLCPGRLCGPRRQIRRLRLRTAAVAGSLIDLAHLSSVAVWSVELVSAEHRRFPDLLQSSARRNSVTFVCFHVQNDSLCTQRRSRLPNLCSGTGFPVRVG